MAPKNNKFNYLSFLFSITLFVLLLELGLSLLNINPIRFLGNINEPTVYEYDCILGWKAKEGKYTFPKYSLNGDEIKFSFLKDGLRKTSSEQDNIRDTLPKIVFCGGSFMQGWGISDHETLPWKIQKELSDYEVLNYATGGYGTYQSLLALECNLPLLDSPKFVFYGFMDHHELRNVAPTLWIKTLNEFSKRNHVSVPYATIGQNNKLERSFPESYNYLPFHEYLSSVRLIERIRDKFFDDDRIDQKTLVTERIILQMNKFCRSYGAELVFVILSANNETRTHYKEYLENKNIRVIDAHVEFTDELIVKGDGHPNEKVHSQWANIILRDLNRIRSK